MYIYIYVYTCVCVYIYTIYTCMYTYIYIYMYILKRLSLKRNVHHEYASQIQRGCLFAQYISSGEIECFDVQIIKHSM